MEKVKLARIAGLLVIACSSASGGEPAGSRPAASAEPSGEGATVPAFQSAPLPAEPLAWPDILPEELAVAPPTGRKLPIVVYLDAGHGAKDNPGNTSCFCVEEQDFTLSLSRDVRAALLEIGGIRVVESRTGSEQVQYAERVEAARRARADVFVSLHSDIRGTPEEWSPDGAAICRRSTEAPGFAVLYSDEGAPKLAVSRKRLADSLSAALLEAHFLPYQGGEYVDLYEPIPSATGVFVDRHEDRKRIFILRRTTMPTVIVETHNALDPREASAFEDSMVRRAFSLALAKGIIVSLAGEDAPR